MSGFSDADLDELKEITRCSEVSTIPVFQTNEKVRALLARLEAAEKVAKMCFECMYEDERPLPGSILDQAHKEWIASKGGAGK